MAASPPPALKSTPLRDRHEALGARLVPYAGWEMPVEYSGISDEHLAVREAAGLFDVSHMGEIEVAGAGALAAVQWVTTNDASRLDVGHAQYTAITTCEGTFVDDVLLYRLADEHFLFVVNAANSRKASRWLTDRIAEHGADAAVVNTSSRYALVAVQGPEATAVLQALTDVDLSEVGRFRCVHGEVAAVRATMARTGYTGEDGFEILCPPQQAGRLWDALMEAGRPRGLKPCGLGARDTLRLEACLRLYGQDIDETVTPLEAGLGWIVAWNKGDFVGRGPLDQQRAAGPDRRLAAFDVTDRGIARPGHPVVIDGQVCGTVTSGTQTPYLKRAVGLAMVPAAAAAVGTTFDVDIRGRLTPARVVPEPFYRRDRGRSRPAP